MRSTFFALMTALVFAMSAAAQARIPAELPGKWFEGSSSILQEKNTFTGAVASRYGSSIGYTFEPDGTFRFAGLMKSTMYGCTTTLWNDRRGSYSVEGDVITMRMTKDYWFNNNSCSASSTKEQNKPLVTKTYNYEIGVREGRTWLCMRETGKTSKEDITCFPRTDD
jgi:hypothetical protein